MAHRPKTVRSRMIVTLDAFSETETLESLERAAHYIGLGGSYSKGERVPKWQLPLLKIQKFRKTRFCLLHISAGLRAAVARLESFHKSAALRAAARLRSRYGHQVSLVATLAVFRRAGEDGLGVPLPSKFICDCAKHGIKIGFITYC